MPAKLLKKRRTCVTPTKTSEVLNVKIAAELLAVSPDPVENGSLPGILLSMVGELLQVGRGEQHCDEVTGCASENEQVPHEVAIA